MLKENWAGQKQEPKLMFNYPSDGSIAKVTSCRDQIKKEGVTISLLLSKVMTTFPRACPCSRYRIASGTSLKLQHLSITGVTFPAFMSSPSMSRSSLLIFAINVTNFWLTKGDNTRSVI